MKEEKLVDAIRAGGLCRQDAKWCARWIPEAFEGLKPEAVTSKVRNEFQIMDYDELIARCEYLDIPILADGWPDEDNDFIYFTDAGLTGILVIGYL